MKNEQHRRQRRVGGGNTVAWPREARHHLARLAKRNLCLLIIVMPYACAALSPPYGGARIEEGGISASHFYIPLRYNFLSRGGNLISCHVFLQNIAAIINNDAFSGALEINRKADDEMTSVGMAWRRVKASARALYIQHLISAMRRY